MASKLKEKGVVFTFENFIFYILRIFGFGFFCFGLDISVLALFLVYFALVLLLLFKSFSVDLFLGLFASSCRTLKERRKEERLEHRRSPYFDKNANPLLFFLAVPDPENQFVKNEHSSSENYAQHTKVG